MSGSHLFLAITGFLGAFALAEALPDAPSPTPNAAPAELQPAIELQPTAQLQPAAEVQAEPEIATPVELTETIREQDAAIKALDEQDTEARAALRLWYATELDTMRQEAITQGDLDHVIALDLERQRIDTEITADQKARLFYTLRELRSRFERRRADQMRHATAEARAGLQRYAVVLDHLAAVFLEHGNGAAARVVARARLSLLGAAPTTAVASAPARDPSWGSSVPPAPGSTGSGSASASRSASSGSGSWGSAAATTQGTAPAHGNFSAGSASARTWQSASAANGAPSWGSPKTAAAPAATSLSAPPRVQAAQQTVKNLASQVSRGSASGAGVVVTRPPGPGGPAPRGGPAGTGIWAR